MTFQKFCPRCKKVTTHTSARYLDEPQISYDKCLECRIMTEKKRDAVDLTKFDEVDLNRKEGPRDVFVLTKKEALESFEDLMAFQYGDKKESDAAFKRILKKDEEDEPEEF